MNAKISIKSSENSFDDSINKNPLSITRQFSNANRKLIDILKPILFKNESTIFEFFILSKMRK
jgi:hypothetical protein